MELVTGMIILVRKAIELLLDRIKCCDLLIHLIHLLIHLFYLLFQLGQLIIILSNHLNQLCKHFMLLLYYCLHVHFHTTPFLNNQHSPVHI
ncbi:hypothetical protein D3C71_1735350 [compost metagenome]